MSELHEQAMDSAKMELDEAETYSNVDRLLNISYWAGIISWFVLGVYLINTGLVLRSFIMNWAALWADKLSGFGNVVGLFQGLLVALSFFFVLQGVKHGLLALADVVERAEG